MLGCELRDVTTMFIELETNNTGHLGIHITYLTDFRFHKYSVNPYKILTYLLFICPKNNF